MRALDSSAHLVAADLEDSVPAAEKSAARDVVREAFSRHREQRLRAVRINARDRVDIDFVSEIRTTIDAVLVPKAVPEALLELEELDLPLLPIVETATGVLTAFEVASLPNVRALCLGNLDLTSELGLSPRDDGAELLTVRSQLVLASSAAHIRRPFDGVHAAFKDVESLRREVALVRSLGFGGKQCIHPDQVDAVNGGFAATETELAWARQVIEADALAARDGTGVAVVAGEMVDAPVVARARRLLQATDSGD